MTASSARDRSGATARLWAVLNTLFMRGAGSGLAVLLTILVARFVEPGAAKFLLLFNITTMAAVCFRWGLDELIVRQVAVADEGGRTVAASHLMALAHRRVMVWWLASAAGVLAAWPLLGLLDLAIDLAQVQLALLVGALVALTACAGRVIQGAGRTNAAALILNILFPAALVVGVCALAWAFGEVHVWALLGTYAGAAAVAYVAVVVGGSRRGRRPRLAPLSLAADRRAANRLGGVVLAQQVLGWVVLLVVPVAYGDAIYTSFVIVYKVANLVNLVMLAVNFTFASRLAAMFHAHDLPGLRRLTVVMLGFVGACSVVAGVAVVVLRGVVYDLADVEVRLDAVFVIVVVAQVFFALAAVCALVLSMCGDEKNLLRVQGAVATVGVSAFVAATFVGPLWGGALTLALTYLTLFILLLGRARVVLRTPQPTAQSN